MDRLFFVLGAISGFMSVALGAFGAHALRQRLQVPPDLMRVWETGTHYQMMHALALLAIAFVAQRFPQGPWVAAGWCFVAGTVLFSGSLYALTLSGVRWLGAITPLGGLCFLIGWILLVVSALRG
ncbi:MAG TPA: DUF423 domain-containing protein [Stenomitos sp.]